MSLRDGPRGELNLQINKARMEDKSVERTMTGRER